jgi:hypothetical protein
MKTLMVATVFAPALTGCMLAFHAEAESDPAAVSTIIRGFKLELAQ